MELEALRALLRAKMEIHPELTAPLMLPGLRRILERENVGWLVRPLPRPAQLVPYLDRWTIIVDAKQPERQYCYLGAHELGHLWLHHDRLFERSETRVYNMSDTWEADPEEDDAETFATMVLQGPRLWMWEPGEPPPDPAPRVRGSAPRPLPRSAQIEFGESMPPAHLRPLDTRTLWREPRVEMGFSIDEWYFVEESGRSWRIYDVAVAGSRKEVLELGDIRAVARIFVPAMGRRRVYRFERGERHEMSAGAVAKQWAEAISLSRRPASR